MGKHVVLVLVLFFLTASCLTLPLPVKAEHGTIIVPDDYPTITAAVGNATNGDTILVRSGTYNEQSLKTNKSISLIGEGADSTIVNLIPPIVNFTVMGQYVGTGHDAAIAFQADNIVISGFTINYYGAIAIFGDHVIFMGNIISSYEGNWLHVNGNYETISNNTLNVVTDVQCSYSGVSANTGTGSVIISNGGSCNSVFYNNMSGSIGGATISSSNLYYGNLVQNGDGIFANLNDLVYNNTVIGCSHGIYMITGSNNVIIGNTIINNSGAGLANNGYVMGDFANCGANDTFMANYVANNAVGILIDTSYQWHGANFTVYNNNFIDNAQQAQVAASNSSNAYENYLFSLNPLSDCWNFSQQGNYWSDYNGTDANGDGIGDSPYLVGGNESDYQPLMTPFDISSINIQLPSWANLSLPNLLSTLSFPPQPSPSPSPSPSPTPSPSPSPTASPSPSPSPTPLPTQEPFPTTLVATASGASAIVIGVGLLVYFRKRRHFTEPSVRKVS